MDIARSSAGPFSGHSVGTRLSAMTGAIGPVGAGEFCTPTESSRPPVEPHPAKESVRIVVSVDSKIAFFIKIPSQNREVLW